MTEHWREIPGHEGYEVSDLGRVRGLDREVPNGSRTMFVRGRVLAPIRSGNGKYLTVSLKRLGRNHSVYIHRAVAEAFLGPCPAGLQCCHNNGDGHDNRRENLRWDTAAENSQDALRHGTHPQASKTHCIHGHEFTPENTYVWTNPKTGALARMCRPCRADRRTAA